MQLNLNDDDIRPPAIAGTFYPHNPDELADTVRHYLTQAGRFFDTAHKAPKAIIAPHAGYIYSGFTAAAVYNRLYPSCETIRRVIMLGPCHRVAINYAALPSSKLFQTPIGNIPVDTDSIDNIKHLDYVKIFNATHAKDHCIEIHLPFLQMILKKFKIVPIIIGDISPLKVAEIIETLWGGPETLILVSSDLSHYLDHTQANTLDSQTSKIIERMDFEALRSDQACGCHSIKGLLMVARKKRLSAYTADVRNSGDTAGSKDRVVGYGSWYFERKYTNSSNIKSDLTSSPDYILKHHGDRLLYFAASTIFSQFSNTQTKAAILPKFEKLLYRKGASFITLTKEGHLRGCIGSIQPIKPLITDIADNAYKAAFEDPRFPKLSLAEIESNEITLSLSILGPQTQINFSSESELIEKLRPGLDGIILQKGTKYRSTFLPSVWEQLPNPKKFINELKFKAGLARDYWSNDIQIWRYNTSSRSSSNLPPMRPLWPTRTD